MNNPLSNTDLSPSRGRKTASERDYHYAKTDHTKGFLVDIGKQSSFMLRYRLHFASFRDLVNLYLAWMDGRGLTVYGLVVEGETSGSTFRACNIRLSILRDKGFISVIGKRDKYAVYAPTEKAIRELSELCEGI